MLHTNLLSSLKVDKISDVDFVMTYELFMTTTRVISSPQFLPGVFLVGETVSHCS